MKSIRKFAYAAVLTLSALNFAPSLASAQDEGGTFRLPHEVHWQNACGSRRRLPVLDTDHGPSEMLTLTKTQASQRRSSCSQETLKLSRLPRQHASKSSRSSVQATSALWTFPSFEVTLHFAAPANSGKEVRRCAPLPPQAPADSARRPGADLPRFCSRFFMFEINQRVLEGGISARHNFSGSNFSRQIHEDQESGVPFHFVTQYNRFGNFLHRLRFCRLCRCNAR